ncbi:hypothetical protein SVAN01_01515 [Stagonosporopsis vannaccii]|nr:hypothetical protein SVAN01_01515 [Stagonosporopsis vannaccii]
MSLDIRKSGIPVLGYAHCNAPPTPSAMMFRFNERQATASILLQWPLLVVGHDAPQTFTAQYDADNVAAGALGPATLPLPQARLDGLAREGNPQMQTLTLTLSGPPPLWVPQDVGLRPRPQPGHEAAFGCVAALARATSLHVLFDFKWLHRDHHAVFHRLVAHPRQLRAYPVWRHYSKHHRREDWRVLGGGGVEDGGLERHDDGGLVRHEGGGLLRHEGGGLLRHEDGELAGPEESELLTELPPQYAESCKRPRHGGCCTSDKHVDAPDHVSPVTPTPASPPPKRALLSLSPYDAHPSPTEKDSAATPSPKPPLSSAPPSPRFHPLDVPPDARRSRAAADPDAAAATHAHPALESAVSALLPDLLSSLLPALLPRLLALQSPSPAPTLLSGPSQRSTPPPDLSALRPAPAAPLSALGVSVSDHVARSIEAHLSSLYAHTLSHAHFLRNEADAAFFDDREGERLAWEKDVEAAFDAFQERLADAAADEVHRVEGVLAEQGSAAVERAERLQCKEEALKGAVQRLRGESRALRREKRDLKSDVAHLRRQKADLRRDVKELRRAKRESRQTGRESRQTERELSRESVTSQHRTHLDASSTLDSQDLDA